MTWAEFGWCAFALGLGLWGWRWKERAERLAVERDRYRRMERFERVTRMATWGQDHARIDGPFASYRLAEKRPDGQEIWEPIRDRWSDPNSDPLGDIMRHIDSYKDRPIKPYDQGGTL